MRAIYEDPAPVKVFMKAAQVAATEYGLNCMFWAIDTWGMDVLYLLPTGSDASDFSAGRVNPAIEESERLSGLFTDVQNVGHKRAGSRSVYIRGSQRRTGLKSVPADLLIIDEYDEMVQIHLPLARTRLDASPWKWELDLSTPTIPEYGIHARFLESDQREYYVQCERCRRWQRPTFEDNVERDAPVPFYRCAKCRRQIDALWRLPGRWVPTNPGAALRGYHLTQLISPTITAADLAGLAARTAPEDVQEFHNSHLGEPFVAEGGQLSHEILNACRRADYAMPDTGEHATMGVDVGGLLHVRISAWKGEEKIALHIGKVGRFEDLDLLMARYNVDRCVIDALPETRKAQEFAGRFPGRVWLAFYSPIDPTKRCEWRDDLRKVLIHRTLAMDGMFNRFLLRQVILPANAATIPDYYEQLRAPVRIIEKNPQGIPAPRYVELGKPDHFAHAEVYDEIAGEGRRRAWRFVV
jgi:phage terminase large subunit GpA-like protein